MSCTGKKVTIYADGAIIVSPARDYGCNGEVRRFHIVTDMDAPVSYRWSLDGVSPVLGTSWYFDYPYTLGTHELYVEVRSGNCAMQRAIKVTGRTCVNCTVVCNQETVDIPAGQLMYLKDTAGKAYPITRGVVTQCISGLNLNGAADIKKAIREGTNCDTSKLRVFMYHNESGKNCLSLVINNSPIVFDHIKVGGQIFYFNTNKCVV